MDTTASVHQATRERTVKSVCIRCSTIYIETNKQLNKDQVNHVLLIAVAVPERALGSRVLQDGYDKRLLRTHFISCQLEFSQMVVVRMPIKECTSIRQSIGYATA